MRFIGWALKRASNIRHHGLDFSDAERVFYGSTCTFEDDRFDYGKRRFNTLRLLDGVPISVIHTETDDEIRIISFRKATRSETALLFRFFQH